MRLSSKETITMMLDCLLLLLLEPTPQSLYLCKHHHHHPHMPLQLPLHSTLLAQHNPQSLDLFLLLVK